ncbi:signal peptide peptidase SppA [Hyphobacterium sp. HN65]|uniref:Signal peptide peptidase SppA n=1 Tax=Hyphobacterium lacteum TaxID=3116575 RepID=A0ABU7LSW6_9PROT|nr:signal peptide peptidase SppA [Hyphobacterium sp. HN65]MEE2527015.1 signal peptide peptidase SppA [Hyphobacterium sp. HN65]
MKQFFVTLFGSIIGVIIGSFLTLILVIMGIGAMFSAMSADAEQSAGLPQGRLVLEVDLREPRLDQPSRSPFAFAEPASIVDLVRLLDRAENDPRVAGLFIRANEFGMAPAQAEEINRAIASFRESGRPVIVHSQGFNSTSVTTYLAVASADEIWLQDTASFATAGLAGEVGFFGDALERFEIDADFIQFLEYKNAPNTYTENGFTPEHLEATLSYFNSIYDTAIANAAAGRTIDADNMRTLIEASPYSAEDALESGLVDQLGHVAAARQAAIGRAGGGATIADIEDYRFSGVLDQNGPRIALIEGQGSIVTGDALASPFGGDPMIGGDAMAEAISHAAATPGVEAIIVRVDSPGGSSIASDQVWDAIRRAQGNGLPVVVSMGSAAASGGYYIAAPADHIVANASTITGSIGVFGGKINLGGAFGLLGVNFEQVSVGGEFAGAYSANENWTPEQREAIEAGLSEIYDDFTQRVAEGRDLSAERVSEIARGRVWTGQQALELGLVDEVGGFMDAVAAARRLAGIEENRTVHLQRFPRERTPFEAFQELFGVSAEGAQSLAQLNALMNTPEFQALMEARQANSSGQELRSPAVQPR